jgi:hypothetical protein
MMKKTTKLTPELSVCGSHWGAIGGLKNIESSRNFAQRCSIWWRRGWEGQKSDFIV